MRKRQVEAGTPPVVSRYRQALDGFRGKGRETPLFKRVSEMASLLDVTTTLGSGLGSEESLGEALFIVTRELQVARGAFFVRSEGGALDLRAWRGLPPGAPPTLGLATAPDDFVALGPGDELHDRHGLVLLVPVDRRERPIAVLGLGPREGGQSYGVEERSFLRSVAACVAAPIENSLIDDQLRRVHQRLSRKCSSSTTSSISAAT